MCRKHLNFVTIAISLGLFACGSVPSADLTMQGSGATGRQASGRESGASLGKPIECTQPGTPRDPVTDAGTLKDLLVGIWVDCREHGDKEPLVPVDLHGIAFEGDGRWYFLRHEGQDFVHQYGFDWEGTYTVQDYEMAHAQLEFNFSGGGGLILQHAFRDEPRKVKFDSMGTREGVFVKVTGGDLRHCYRPTEPRVPHFLAGDCSTYSVQMD